MNFNILSCIVCALVCQFALATEYGPQEHFEDRIDWCRENANSSTRDENLNWDEYLATCKGVHATKEMNSKTAKAYEASSGA